MLSMYFTLCMFFFYRVYVTLFHYNHRQSIRRSCAGSSILCWPYAGWRLDMSSKYFMNLNLKTNHLRSYHLIISKLNSPTCEKLISLTDDHVINVKSNWGQKVAFQPSYCSFEYRWRRWIRRRC